MALSRLISEAAAQAGMGYALQGFLQILPFDISAVQNIAPPLGPSVSAFAAKHFDLQFGMDIHQYSAPPPAPPFPATPPIPLPTPNMAMVFDVCDYIPIIGNEVYVNGVKSGVAGSDALTIHIPLGIPVPLPDPLPPPVTPGFDNEIFMGSQTVLTGSPFSRLGMPVLECNMVGIVPPIRLKRKSINIPVTTLPMGMNLSTPTNVFVGGPPTIDMFNLLMKGVMAGLNGLKKTQVYARAMDSFQGFRQRAFSGLPPGMLKCDILRAEPVDIRHGSVVVAQRDFDIPGRLPLAWPRRYASRFCDEPGLCGLGWRTPADIRLEIEPDGSASIVFPDRSTLFPSLPTAVGEDNAVYEFIDGARLFQAETPQGKELHVKVKGDLLYAFASPENLSVPSEGNKLKLPIERIEDLCGNFWRFKRTKGKLTGLVERSIDDQPGRQIRIHEENGRIAQMHLYDSLTQRAHPLVCYNYDSQGNLCAAADVLNAKRTFNYTGHYLSRHTDRLGQSFYYEYDEQWQVVHAWGDGGLHDYRFIYHREIRETEVIDSLGHTSLIKFDDNNLPICEIDPLGGVTSYEYDQTGHTTAVTNPAGLRTTFEYDSNGNETKVTQPDGSTVQTVFDTDSRPVSITDVSGELWRQQWDQRGLLIAQTTPSGATTRYLWDTWGQLSEHTQPNGARTRLSFDRYGNLASLTNALGHTDLFAHDERGCLLHHSDALGQSATYAYDSKARLRQARQFDGTDIFIKYDAEDQPVSYTDEKGQITHLEYAGTGKLTAVKQADGHSIRYLYDTEEQLTGIIDQNGATYQLKRDPLGRVIEETDYWGQSTHYQYDAIGRLQTRTDPLGQVIAYQTDALGRITRKTFTDPDQPDEQTHETFRYDAGGALIEMRNRHRNVTRKFDALGQLLEEKQDSFTITYAYDEQGNCIERATSAGNRLKQAYDLLGQLSSLILNDAEPVTIERDALGRLTKEHLAAGLSRQFRYDAQSRLTAQVVLRDETPLFGTGYQYDASGELISKRDNEMGTNTYRYSPIGRLLEHIDPASKISRFVADAAGNPFQTQGRRPEQPIGQSPEHVPPNNRWQRSGEHNGQRYCYDAAGNLIRRETICPANDTVQTDSDALLLRWDANHRLIESRRGEQITHYGYDAFGRRAFKRNTTHTTWFFWDGPTAALLAEITQDNAQADALRERQQKAAPYGLGPKNIKRDTERLCQQSAREYIYYPDTFHPFALIEKRQENENIYYYYTDPNGCPTRLTDNQGKVVWATGYEAWGKVQQLYQSEVDNSIRLQGQYFDSETGLHYNTFRYYDPDIGRFISKDPIGLEGGINIYAFAPNPLNWSDPWGLATVDVTFEMGGRTFTGVNPSEREPRVKGRTLRGLGFPNSRRFYMHAEFDAMMEAYDKGFRGGKGVITIEGRDLCDFCKRHIKNMALHLKLSEFIIHERTTGLTYTFIGDDLKTMREGGKGFKGCGV